MELWVISPARYNSVWVCVCVFERQWVNAVLLMRIWKSNHRLRLGKLWQWRFKWHTATAWNKSKQRIKKKSRDSKTSSNHNRYDAQLAHILQMYSIQKKTRVDFLCVWREALCSATEQLDDNSSLIYESLGRVTTRRQLKITASDWQWLVLPSLLISSILPGEIPEISIVFSFNQNGYFQTIDRILRTLCWMDSILGDAPYIKKNPSTQAF